MLFKRVFMQILKLQYYNLQMVSSTKTHLCISCNACYALNCKRECLLRVPSEMNTNRLIGTVLVTRARIINNGQVCAVVAQIATP